MQKNDTYKTIAKNGQEALLKSKNSKFYGYAYAVTTDQEIKQTLEALRKKHHAARHWCYAYKIGIEKPKYRHNDDGEPSNSAGPPIYGQIQSFDITNVLIVVVRYFGGVKLGVGGLISAYKTAAQLAIESSGIVEKLITIEYCIFFEYKHMNSVMRIIKENNIKVINQELNLTCKVFISIRKSMNSKIRDLFSALYEVKIEKTAT